MRLTLKIQSSISLSMQIERHFWCFCLPLKSLSAPTTSMQTRVFLRATQSPERSCSLNNRKSIRFGHSTTFNSTKKPEALLKCLSVYSTILIFLRSTHLPGLTSIENWNSLIRTLTNHTSPSIQIFVFNRCSIIVWKTTKWLKNMVQTLLNWLSKNSVTKRRKKINRWNRNIEGFIGN